MCERSLSGHTALAVRSGRLGLWQSGRAVESFRATLWPPIQPRRKRETRRLSYDNTTPTGTGFPREGAPVALGLGSNLGDRLAHLRFARARLARLLRKARFSPVYETIPVGPVPQPPFLNACCVGIVTLPASDLLREVKVLEREAGRAAGPRLGPRELDIDILLYGTGPIRAEGLEIPHPRLHERAFALVPLSDVAPEWLHPELRRTVGELRDRVPEEGVRRVADESEWTPRERGAGT